MRHWITHPLAIASLGSALSVLACILALNASSNANHSSALALSATKEIRSSRRNSILVSCFEENERNRQAKAGLEALVKHPIQKKKATRTEIVRGQALVNEFVEALVPKYNCAARLAKLTKP